MKVHYIQTADALSTAIQSMQEKKRLALDLEFDKNRYAYGFNLCLLQIASDTDCYLVDPFANLEVATIFPLLEDPKIELVTYSFDEDMRLLHSLGCMPNHIFDNSTAYGLLDYPPSSLAKALISLLGVELQKSKQTSNWMKRPLSRQQLAYAANDVLHLFDLQDEILRIAREDDILDWIAQENKYLETLDYTQIGNNSFLKDKERRLLTPFQWHIFAALMTCREEIAAQLKKPSYQVLDKQYLIELAEDPSKIKNFHQQKQLHRSLRNARFRARLEQILQSAKQEAEENKLPRTGNAIKRLDRSEYLQLKAEEKVIEQAKETVFQPIQKAIQADFGEHTMRLILNNKLIAELVRGNKTRLLPYKQKLLEEYSKELQIDIQQYI